MLVFRKILRTYYMNDPYQQFKMVQILKKFSYLKKLRSFLGTNENKNHFLFESCFRLARFQYLVSVRKNMVTHKNSSFQKKFCWPLQYTIKTILNKC